MIDKWNRVNTLIKTAVQSEYPKAVIGTDINNSLNPSQFPYVFVNQLGSEMVASDMEFNENAIRSTFEIQVFSAESILQARAILTIVNDTLVSKGFKRTTYRQVANTQNANIYRMVARFERVIADGDII